MSHRSHPASVFTFVELNELHITRSGGLLSTSLPRLGQAQQCMKKAPLIAGQRVGGCQLRDESDDWRSLVAEVVGPDLIVHSGI